MTSKEMLTGIAMSKNVMQYDAAQLAAIANLQRRVDYWKVLEHRGDKRHRAGSSVSSSGGAALDGREENVIERNK